MSMYVIAMPEQEKPEDDSEEESKEDAETAGGCEQMKIPFSSTEN